MHLWDAGSTISAQSGMCCGVASGSRLARSRVATFGRICDARFLKARARTGKWTDLSMERLPHSRRWKNEVTAVLKTGGMDWGFSALEQERDPRETDDELIRLRDGYGVFNDAPLSLPAPGLFASDKQMAPAFGLVSSLSFGRHEEHLMNRRFLLNVFEKVERDTGVRFNEAMGVEVEKSRFFMRRKDWPPKRITKEGSARMMQEFAEACAEGKASCGIDKMHRGEIAQFDPELMSAVESRVVLCGRLPNASRNAEQKTLSTSASVEGVDVKMSCLSFDASIQNSLWVDSAAHCMIPESNYIEIQSMLEKASDEKLLCVDAFLVVEMTMASEIDIVGRAPRTNWVRCSPGQTSQRRDICTDLVLRFRNCKMTCFPMATKSHFENALTYTKANVMPLEHDTAMHFEEMPAFYLHSQFANDEMLQMALYSLLTCAHFRRYSLHSKKLHVYHKQFINTRKLRGQPSVYDFVSKCDEKDSMVLKIRKKMQEERGRAVLCMQASHDDDEILEKDEAVPPPPVTSITFATPTITPPSLDLGASLFQTLQFSPFATLPCENVSAEESMAAMEYSSVSVDSPFEDIDWDEIEL